MASRAPTDPGVDLERIRKEQAKPRHARLRIMIASDPTRPIRTISLPRRLPLIASIVVGTLALATIVLACGSWKLSDALSGVERRMFAMVRAADSVALGSAEAGIGTSGGSSAQGPAGGVHAPVGGTGRFILQSANTGEELEVTVNLATGEVEAEGYRRFRHLMRCLRTTAETPIDPRLIDLLYRIAQRTGQKIILVSGFRAPMFSLAQLSYHTRGMAADIRIPGMTPLMVRDLVASMGVKGIGYYPVSGFVHVDVRDQFTTWTDYGRDRQDGEGAEHGPEHGERGASPPLDADEDEPSEPAAP
jgi:uncharacterized protein YcbK (DUF882 family)